MTSRNTKLKTLRAITDEYLPGKEIGKGTFTHIHTTQTKYQHVGIELLPLFSGCQDSLAAASESNSRLQAPMAPCTFAATIQILPYSTCV
jgi:hypothetical protein